MSISSTCPGCDTCSGNNYNDGITLDPKRFYNSNTWGFSRKIGQHTFGNYFYQEFFQNHPTKIHECTWDVKDEDRAQIREKIRYYTKILDIGGYIPGIAIVAGIIRIIAASILSRWIEKNITNGQFSGQLALEARRTYKAQIKRGVYELIPVFGMLYNLHLDYKWYKIWEWPVKNLTKEEMRQ